MRYLKESKEYAIHLICEEYGISNYTINEDHTINVDGDVSIRNTYITKLPLQFKEVTGGFYCSNNRLISLIGCPSIVGDAFSCLNNQITSLEYAPIEVGTDFNCGKNFLTSLKGCPKIINGIFNCSNNHLVNLLNGPTEVTNTYVCSENKLTTLKGCPKIINYGFMCNNNKLTTFEDGPEQINNGSINILRNQISTLKGFPKISNNDKYIYMNYNFLPKEISLYIYKNGAENQQIKTILRYQDDYQIWNENGTLNIHRFEMMMDEITSSN